MTDTTLTMRLEPWGLDIPMKEIPHDRPYRYEPRTSLPPISDEMRERLETTATEHFRRQDEERMTPRERQRISDELRALGLDAPRDT